MKETRDLIAGVVGLGMIGGGVAASLARSGRTQFVYNRTPGKHKNFPGVPAELATPRDVAERADVIMIAVFNYEQCRMVITGENGLLEGAHEGMVICCLSTIKVDECRELARICAEKGVGFIDAGVSPGSKAAENGLIAMCGAEPEIFAYAKPVLDDWSAEAILCGPVGAGMTVKVVRNFTTFAIWRITTEAARLCHAADVNIAKFTEVLDACDKVDNLAYSMLRHRAKSADGKLPAAIGERYPQFMMKDLAAAVELEKQCALDLPVLELVRDLVDDTCDLKHI